MKDWKGHSACNQYGVAAEKKREEDQKSARAQLERFAFFFDRYNAHSQAVGFAAKTREAAAARMTSLQEMKVAGQIAAEPVHT